MNSKISCHLKEAPLRECAESIMAIQNDSILKAYMNKAKVVAKESGAVICDLFSVWEKMSGGGVDTTELLANNKTAKFIFKNISDFSRQFPRWLIEF